MWGGADFADFRDKMHTIAEYGRYLLNGIAWIAKIEVPAERRAVSGLEMNS